MKVLIATPVFGRSVDIGYHISVLEAMAGLVKAGIGFAFCHEARNLINQARNRSAHYAINNGFDKILFIDSDIQFKPADVLELVKSNKRVIGGTYPLKTFPIRLNFVPLNPTEKPVDLDPNELMKGADEHGDLEVYMIPGGMMCVDVSVFKDLEPYVEKYHHRDPFSVNREYECMYFPFSINKTGELQFEDWSFCELVRTKLKEKIWWKTSVIGDHVGHHVFSAWTPIDQSYKKLDIHEKAELVQNPFSKWPRNLYCFCGSGKKFKHCHEEQAVGSKVTSKEAETLKPEYARILSYVQGRADKGLDYKLKTPAL